MDEKPKTKIVVDAENLKSLMTSKGFGSVESVVQRAKELGKPVALSTIYNILRNGNWQKESAEALAQVLDVDLSAFLSFEPEPK